MCTATQIDAKYTVAANTVSRAHVRREAEDSAPSHGRPEILPIAPEAIVGELVKQYLHCSTTISGIFRCW